MKRNLTLEINISSKDENAKALSFRQGPTQTFDAHGEAQREKYTVPSNVGDVVAGGLAKDYSTHGAENSELKQFAADFLSLYCRYCSFTHLFRWETTVTIWRDNFI